MPSRLALSLGGLALSVALFASACTADEQPQVIRGAGAIGGGVAGGEGGETGQLGGAAGSIVAPTGGAAGIPGGVWVGEGRAVYIEAECAHGPTVGSCRNRFAGQQNGTEAENNGNTVGYIDSGDYLMYPGIDFTGLNTLLLSYATERGGPFDVRFDAIDGPLVATFEATDTGGWTAWRGGMTALGEVEGVHDLYLVGGGTGHSGIANLDYMVAGICTPDCGGKECGDDGCGGVCGEGTCGLGLECSAEQLCVPCEPACAGKDCGDDTCGGSCGSCGEGEVCDASRACVAYGALGGPDRLHVSGRELQNPAGEATVLRGISLIDLGAQHVWRPGGVPAMIDQLTTAPWAPRVLRLPIYASEGPRMFPSSDRIAREAYMDEILRPAVDQATAMGLYVILDFHEISNVTDQKDQETLEFWGYMAGQFADYPNVIYEVFNEPSDNVYACVRGDNDDCWPPFKARAQGWVDRIRQDAPETLVLVGGPSWSQVIGPAADDPIGDPNVAYVGHIYPMHLGGGFVEAQIARCAAVHPVVLTEWGYDENDPDFPDYQVYIDTMQALIADNGLSWTAWVADYDWWPPLLTQSGGLTHFGQTVQDWLAAESP